MKTLIKNNIIYWAIDDQDKMWASPEGLHTCLNGRIPIDELRKLTIELDCRFLCIDDGVSVTKTAVFSESQVLFVLNRYKCVDEFLVDNLRQKFLTQEIDTLRQQVQMLEAKLSLFSQKIEGIEAIVRQHDIEIDQLHLKDDGYSSIFDVLRDKNMILSRQDIKAIEIKCLEYCAQKNIEVIQSQDPRFGDCNLYPCEVIELFL